MINKITNEILDKIILELNKDDNMYKIKNNIIRPVMYQLYKQVELYIIIYSILFLLLIIFIIIILFNSFRKQT